MKQITDFIHNRPRLRRWDRRLHHLATAVEHVHGVVSAYPDAIGGALIAAGLALRLWSSWGTLGLVILAIGAIIFGVLGDYGTSPFEDGDSA